MFIILSLIGFCLTAAALLGEAIGFLTTEVHNMNLNMLKIGLVIMLVGIVGLVLTC